MRSHTCGELRKADAGKEVTLQGWVDAFRVSGKISFILLRDRTGITQIFVNKSITEQLKDLKKESVIEVKGKVNARPDKQVKKDMATGEVELEASAATILSMSEVPLPIELEAETTTGLDKRLDYRFLDLRRDKISFIFRVRSRILAATVAFFEKEKFIAIQTPKVTASGVESGAEEFKFSYFGKEASLAQSPQVYKQMMVVSGLEKVYEIGTVFRAEKSHTTRHLTEFTGIDFEMGFIESEQDVMAVLTKYFQYLTKDIKENFKDELKKYKIEINVPKEIPQLTLDEARKILKKHNKEVPKDDDLDAEGERLIAEHVKKEYNCDFVFMLEYPWAKRPFYHMRPEGNNKITSSFDLIYNGVEIATGAQREHRLEVLEAQCKEKGLDLKKMDFYRNIFRYGCPPHGGVGLGLDRITQLMLGLGNVREAILLPRDPERLTP